VLAVLAYHCDLPLPGGFLGVDVFFVISGYLMTALLSPSPDSGRLPVAAFYAGRFRRLYPAMCATIAAVLAAGFVWYAPDRYTAMAERALAAVLSVANISFWLDASNYFAPASADNPLLHLWSLGVEAQFYLLFPWLVWLAARVRGWARVAGCVTVMVGSFGASLAVSTINADAAFYLLPFRAWEFLAGGVAYAVYRRDLLAPLGPAPQLAGLLGLACSFLLVDGAQSYSGVASLLPVLATALILGARHRGVLLTSAPAVWIGTISYSVYLWHWPIWLFTQQVTGDINPVIQAVCVLGAILVGWASYALIEQPGRTWMGSPVVTAGAAALLLTAAGGVVWSGGASFRVPELLRDPSGRYVQELVALGSSRYCFLQSTETPKKPGAGLHRCTGSRNEESLLGRLLLGGARLWRRGRLWRNGRHKSERSKLSAPAGPANRSQPELPGDQSVALRYTGADKAASGRSVRAVGVLRRAPARLAVQAGGYPWAT
jgi:peptidoglycan/LPS O-acetylase OafA/YrhL